MATFTPTSVIKKAKNFSFASQREAIKGRIPKLKQANLREAQMKNSKNFNQKIIDILKQETGLKSEDIEEIIGQIECKQIGNGSESDVIIAKNVALNHNIDPYQEKGHKKLQNVNLIHAAFPNFAEKVTEKTMSKLSSKEKQDFEEHLSTMFKNIKKGLDKDSIFQFAMPSAFYHGLSQGQQDECNLLVLEALKNSGINLKQVIIHNPPKTSAKIKDILNKCYQAPKQDMLNLAYDLAQNGKKPFIMDNAHSVLNQYSLGNGAIGQDCHGAKKAAEENIFRRLLTPFVALNNFYEAKKDKNLSHAPKQEQNKNLPKEKNKGNAHATVKSETSEKEIRECLRKAKITPTSVSKNEEENSITVVVKQEDFLDSMLALKKEYGEDAVKANPEELNDLFEKYNNSSDPAEQQELAKEINSYNANTKDQPKKEDTKWRDTIRQSNSHINERMP